MAANPAFELFEVLCVELAATSPQIISWDRVGAALIDDLKDQFDEPSEAAASAFFGFRRLEPFRYGRLCRFSVRTPTSTSTRPTPPLAGRIGRFAVTHTCEARTSSLSCLTTTSTCLATAVARSDGRLC